MGLVAGVNDQIDLKANELYCVLFYFILVKLELYYLN